MRRLAITVAAVVAVTLAAVAGGLADAVAALKQRRAYRAFTRRRP